MSSPNLTYKTTISLQYNHDCDLLGVTPDFDIYVEEIYSSDAWIAQHHYNLDGERIESVDEDYGNAPSVAPIALPSTLVRPNPGWHMMALNFAGPRHRGMRGPERIVETVRSLSIQTKMAIVERFSLDIPPLMILGLAESYVISEVELVRPSLYFVCRRVRIAYSLPEVKYDEDNEPYDYETLVIYLAHYHDKNRGFETPFEDLFDVLPDVTLNRPMDCVMVNNHLFIADSGGEDATNAIHIWEIDLAGLGNDSTSTKESM